MSNICLHPFKLIFGEGEHGRVVRRKRKSGCFFEGAGDKRR
jgi:hypothetical protein